MPTHTYRPPPTGKKLNHEGEPRHIGVEIEFAAVTAADATRVVQSLFGGKIKAIGTHQFQVSDTELGDFQCELDVQYAHGGGNGDNSTSLLMDNFVNVLRQFVGDISSLVAPCEVVCPPIEFNQLPRIDELREALRKAGAEGTGEWLLYAFGAQLNPEIASRSATYILSILKAYLLMSDWLRAEICVDPTRRLLTYADPFPTAYAELVLDPAYSPDLYVLMENHLAYNPTRNRELDLLPLFCWLDEQKIRESIDDPRIKPRPTFHYRLPDAQLQDPDWSIATEWNRWCNVEYLANDLGHLNDACRAWQRNQQKYSSVPWAEECKSWIV